MRAFISARVGVGDLGLCCLEKLLSNRINRVRIAFDTGTLNQRYRNQGIYNYARQLLGQFQTLALTDNRSKLSHFFTLRRRMTPTCSRICRVCASHVRGCSVRKVVEVGGAWLATLVENPDLLFCPNFTSLQFGPCPVVVTIHDATPVVMPSAPESINRKMKFQLAAAAKNSRRSSPIRSAPSRT